MIEEPRGSALVPGRPRRLFLGVLLSWLVPNVTFAVVSMASTLAPPFDGGVSLHPLFFAYSLVNASLAATLITRRYLALRRADDFGAPAEWTRAAIRRLMATLPVAVIAHVAGGALLMVFGLGDPAVWTAIDLLVAALLGVIVAVQVLVPLGIVCLDEFGIAFGHLVQGEAILPAILRSLPVLVLSVVIATLLPIHEYARTGTVDPGVLALVAVLLPYALVVTILNLRYTAVALQSVVGFLDGAALDRRVDPGMIRPQSLDEIGVVIGGARAVIERIETTRRSLEESEARLRMFAEASSDWFYELDENLRFSWFSERLEAATGIPQASLLGRSAPTLSRLLEGDRRAEHRDDLRAHRPFRDFRARFERADGSVLHIRVSALPVFDADGRFRGYRGSGTDITDRVLAEQRLREQEQQLAQAQKMEAVGQLTGGIAHDFNNLLTTVAGNLQLLPMRRSELEDDPLLGEALAATRRAGDLVQRLLAFARRQELRPENVDVGDKLHGMAELLRRTLGAGIALDVTVSGRDVCARVDPAQFESALLNLALNARDAMPTGGSLTLAALTTTLIDHDDLPDGRYVRVTVTDTGTGIDATLLSQVFEPFFSTKAPGQGSGLGLSMVYGFVRQSEGGVHIDSTPGRGTRVAMLLPAAESAAAAGSAAAADLQVRRAERVGAGIRGARVLVVEDESSVRTVVCAALRQLGCSVEAVADGDAAVARLDAPEPPDLVISDVMLPGSVSGVDVVRRARVLLPERPCILMSGYAREHLTADADDVRGLPMLQKPFLLEELEAAVSQSLRSRAVARSSRARRD